ncbi:MAG: DUF1566 domain-containing protein [Thermoanaerobaculia bacterium]
MVLLWSGGVAASLAQAPPPRPEPKQEGEAEKRPTARPPRRVETGPPPPTLVISADMSCRLELDGEPIAELQKDVVQHIRVKPGDHLLQAFPIGIEGPTWKSSIKAPDTGQVTETVELAKLVEEWNEQTKNQDRFEVRDRIVIDHDTGLIWARNVSPEMSWEQVQTYCAGRELDGIRGWRMPVLDELSTLQFEDHESPRQEMTGGDRRWTILGPRNADTEVLPRLIYTAFDHNSVGALWIDSSLERTACSFLGGFGCQVQRKKKSQAAVLCVRPFEAASAPQTGEPGGGG